MKYAQFVRRCFLSAGTDLTSIPTPEAQSVLSRPSSLTTRAAMANDEMPASRLPSRPEVTDDEENGTMGELV